MCTSIGTTARITGAARSMAGWSRVSEARITYDHATHLWTEHALRLDLASDPAAAGSVAVELDLASARSLVATLVQVIAAAERTEAA